MDAHELARWTRFAAKGGIGRCTAVVDCIAQEMGEDLMFLKDDEITVLMQLPEAGIYLGHCEGVVGRFSGKDVRFHGKLKKPVMAKRGSVTVGATGSESRTSISVLEGRSDLPGERSRHASESPSNSRPASRAKQTPSPAHAKSHAPMLSYATSYSRLSEDQSPPSSSTTAVGASHSSMTSGHAKPPHMAISTSGASIFSVGSASVYSEASTATSVYSSADGASERTRSIHSVNSGETEKDVPEYGKGDQANRASRLSGPVSRSESSTLSSTSASTSNATLSASASDISASTSTSSTSFASTTSTYGPDTTNGSFGSVGSISELEAKHFDMSKFGVHTETQTGFVLVPPPLGIGDRKHGVASPVVAPLRLSKSPRLAPLPGLPPSSPLPVPPGEKPRSTPASPAFPSPLSPGSSSSRSPNSASFTFPGSLSPGIPGSLAPGPRSPGLPGSLSPGYRSPAFAHGASSQYTFSSGSSSNGSSPLTSLSSPSLYGGSASPLSLPSPYAGAHAHALTPPIARTPPVLSSSPIGAVQPYSAPLSPPPSSPLPPLPSTSSPVPVPVFPVMSAAAASPRMALVSLPSGMMDVGGRHGRRDGGGDEVEEGTMIRRQRNDSGDGGGDHSEEEEKQVPGLGENKDERRSGVSGDGKGEREDEEDAHSDGEVGIGLSLMAALGGEDDEDEDREVDAEPAKKTSGGMARVSDPRVRANGHATRGSGESGSATPMAWTRYTPTSPISVQSSHGRRRSGEEEGGGNDEEDEDDGAYWDDIYDDYRYSRYSLASKRFSVTSKGSGMSKASSKARTHAPPMPVPPDRPSVDASRPSIGSDGTNGHPRPSLESASSAMSASMPFARPSLTRSASEESIHEATMLPLTAQFPAVPVHVPVRTESRLRIVHDGYMQGGDDHGEKEQQVEHGSSGGIGLNIEVIGVADEDDAHGQEVDVGRQFTSLGANTALSPLLHTTFGSPHSSRYTDLEDGSSDQDHGRRNSNKSGKSTMSSVEGTPKSPIEGGMASALRVKMEAERAPSSGTAPSLVVPSPAPKSASSEAPAVRAIVVDDDEGRATGINITVHDPEAAPLLPVPSIQTPATVATDPVQANPSADRPDDAEKSPFLRLRPQPSQSPHPFARTSMFLPHPNAPKVVHQSQGPMYGRTTTTTPQAAPEPGAGTTTHPQPHPPTPPGTTLYSTHILHQLRSIAIAAAAQGPARRPPRTVFARCQPDLNASMGPVPILFSLDPFPVVPMGPPPGPPMGRGDGKGPGSMANTTPMRAATVSAPVRRGEGVPPNEGAGDTSVLRLPKRSATAVGVDAAPLSPSLPIPREGFVPQVGAARPRSRSFSAFGAHVPVAVPQGRSREEPVMKVQAQGPPSAVAPMRNASLPPALMARHPPPLVLPNGNQDRMLNGGLGSPVVPSPVLSPLLKVPLSPLTQEPLTHSPQFVDTIPVGNGSLASPIVTSPTATSSEREKDASPGVTSRASVSSSDPRSATSLMPGRQGSLDVPPRSSSIEGPPRRSSDSSESRSLVSPPPIPETASQNARPSFTQEPPLRAKLSLPALRVKANMRTKLDDAVSIASLAGSGENETVQVQDMDFELVKPSLPPVPGRASQDSTMTSRDVDVGKPEASPILCDAASMHSSAPRSPLVPTHTHAPPSASTESTESIDAHRQRELKWMALLPTVPASQARRNKKVRKLLQEGVPSSVRYLVWCHLTDSKARALPGVYAKLGKRSRVPAFAEIERDAVEGFPDQTRLHTAQGPLVSLLQAYLSMVPDIQYNSGLTYIAGHLLLLAPEEDAFWIFASMMDAHLRTYFSTNTVQIEIDASLFSKALETIDPALTKKLYVQLSIAPASITRPWFSTLFVGSLSVDHLHRVWDVFLYDGIPYLFRVGLVLINCVRHLLLQATTEEAALAHLVHPPPACLPSATELLVLAANVKLKDDDVRKQRIKMEQQLKRTTQARPPNGVTSVQTSTISLPKT